jgi:carboxypeptidase C (cathepsin A)
VQTVLWHGDSDAVCDWFGGLAIVENITFSGSEELKSKEGRNHTVDGVVGGNFKAVDNLSWLRAFQSGHEVPNYRKCLEKDSLSRRIANLGQNPNWRCKSLNRLCRRRGYTIHEICN